MKNCIDRESYSLAAGLALGLVVLGCGSGSDLANIPDTLHYYMVGGYVRPFTGAQKDKYKSPRCVCVHARVRVCVYSCYNRNYIFKFFLYFFLFLLF